MPAESLSRLHVVGDSISIHYGPHLEARLAGTAQYSRKTGPNGELDEDSDANGGDSRRVRAYLASLPPAGQFDLLLVNCGLHDLRRSSETGELQVPLDEYRANLAEILALARGLAGRVGWVRTTPVVDELHNRPGLGFRRFAADVEAYNRAADEVMRACGVVTLDLFTFTLTLGRAAYSDHVHFTEAARAQQAAFLAGGLYPLLGSPT